jgi:guanylate kinase
MEGKCIIFSAPSGSGKTTIVRHLLDQFPELEFSISACNRPKRPNETHGKDYYFLTPEEFRTKINNKEFLEWEEVYEGRFYGTLKSEIERIWQKGNTVIFDVDVRGGISIKKLLGDSALSVFVLVPSVEELRKRLQARSTESEEDLEKRVQKAAQEMTYSNQFDLILENHDLNLALQKGEEIVRDFLALK